MKVGIMSMQRIENYGSFLQAYGLRQLLQELGHEVCFVDYEIGPCIVTETPAPAQEHSIPYRALRKCYHFALRFGNWISGKTAEEKRIDAMRLRICYSEYVKQLGVTDARTDNEQVDVLVIGSDEVFNCLQTNPAVGYSRQLFGEGVNARKVISYAASAGFTTAANLQIFGIWDEVSQMLKKNFSAVSVRDLNTFELVREATGIPPKVHLDPVLLADFSHEVIEKRDLSNYVVVYSYEERMSNTAEEANAIQQFAHSRGLKTVSIGNFQKWTDLKIEASPFELLGYIKNADYIVTDTFHGTIFSIIFEKQFAVLIRESNQQKLGVLLEQLSLSEQHVKSLDTLCATLLRKIDYRFALETMKQEKANTIEYLKQNI